MKTTMKKVLSMALALVLLLGCLPMTALADTVCEYCHGTGHSATDPHCTICGAYGHDATASHCNSCNWVDGAGHAPGCASLLCALCGAAKHEGTVCCNICNNNGHTPAAEHCDSCHWAVSVGHADDCATRFCNKCGAANHTGYCCTKCNMDGHTADDYHCPGCNLHSGHADSCPVPCNEQANCTSKTHKVTCVAPCTMTVYCTSKAHKSADCPSQLRCTYCGEKGHKTEACSNVFYSCGCSKFLGHKADCTAVKWRVSFNPNYNTAHAITVRDVVDGAKLYDIYTPTRVGYTFEAWYYDASLTSIVPANTTVTGPMTVYAKWKQIAPYNVSVVVFTNGNKTTPTVTLDLYSWAQDGVITLSDLKDAIAKNGIKANNDVGLSVYGPFTPDQWASYISHDYYRNPTEKVEVKNNEATVLYAMVHNVKITKGTTDPYGAIADKTNPKTGDMIYAPVAVMGLSVSTLAVLLYLNKKRAF